MWQCGNNPKQNRIRFAVSPLSRPSSLSPNRQLPRPTFFFFKTKNQLYCTHSIITDGTAAIRIVAIVKVRLPVHISSGAQFRGWRATGRPVKHRIFCGRNTATRWKQRQYTTAMVAPSLDPLECLVGRYNDTYEED